MADNEKYKDTTPNPLEEAESSKVKTEDAAAVPEDKGAEEKPAEPEEAEVVHATFWDFVKYTFIDSKAWSRIFQILFSMAGAYGLLLGVGGEKTLALPALLGAACFTIAALMEVLYIKKFRPEHDKAESAVRLSLVIVFVLITGFFIFQMFNPFEPEVNKNILMIGLIALAAVFAVSFILYVLKNKQKLTSDLIMFAAVALAVIAPVSFVYMNVIPAFVMAVLALVLVMVSLSKDPLEAGGRFKPRIFSYTFVVLIFLLLSVYAFSIIYRPPYKVISYAPITPSYSTEISGLAWSGDSWSFAYNVTNKKKNQNILGIVNALSIGLTELPPKNEYDLKLPKQVDPPIFNQTGSFLIFTAADGVNLPRDIWGVAMNVTLVEKHEEDAKKGERKKEKVSIYDLSIDEAQKKLKADKEALERRYAKGYPVGEDKVLFAAIDKIIEGMNVVPITHKTAWSPDSSRFVFAALDQKNVSHVWISDVNKQEIDRLPRGDGKMMPLWSPEGSRILYVSKVDSYAYLELSDYDGKNARELSIKRASDRALFPLWNSTESMVIYIRNNEFILMNANATNPRKLSKATMPDSPYWLTAAKKRVKLNFTESGNIWRVFTVKPDGKGNKEIFVEKCDEITQPKWSYDGATVVLGCNYGDYGSVWKVNSDGTFRTRLYSGKNPVTDIEWALSSERLAFLVQKKETQELWVVEKDGRDPRMVYESQQGGRISNFTWDLLGKRIAFEETYRRFYFVAPVTNIKIAHIMSQHETYELMPYELFGKNPVWSDDGEILAFIGWDNLWIPSIGSQKVWMAQLQ